MKSPITGKEMVLKTDLIEHEFRKEKFDIVYHYYLCEDSGEKFEDERLTQLNLNQVYNQFRKKQRSEEHTSELQSLTNLVCRLLLEKKKKILIYTSLT